MLKLGNAEKVLRCVFQTVNSRSVNSVVILKRIERKIATAPSRLRYDSFFTTFHHSILLYPQSLKGNVPGQYFCATDANLTEIEQNGFNEQRRKNYRSSNLNCLSAGVCLSSS